jgi:dynein heavy chain
VFKASIAAGNLSLWIRAILAVYDVMTVIEPKKKLLNEAEEALAIRVFHLKNEREELNKFHAVLLEKKKLYEAKLEEKEKVVQRIQEL